MTDAPLDLISLEVFHNGICSITDETFVALMRSAYSTNIKERCDHSTALMDRNGRLVAQAQGSLPIHLGSMLGLMQALLAKFPTNEIHDGDIFVGNDPHVAGGTHLPDVNLAMPIFLDGRLVAFMCCIAHHADMGGMAPGSMAGGMTEIYQEGLRIPPVKLFKRGEIVQDIFDLLLLNVRIPEERRGDYFAQVAACRLGERRFKELAASYSIAQIGNAFDDILARTEKRLRAAIASIPDGTYHFTDYMDDDGVGTSDIKVAVSIAVKGDRMTIDFAGTAAQVAGNINATLNATMAAVSYCLKALFDPDVPNNQGVIAAVDIVAEPGTAVNATFPAAVASRAHICQRIIDAIIGALAPAVPQAAVGAANGANTTAVFSGVDPRLKRPYVYLETLGGGFGGRATKDGKDGVQVHITNTSNLPVEAIELEYPLIVESYGLIEDSGGPGKYRGGMGLRRVIRPVGHTSLFSGTGERFRHRPWGIFGGQPGKAGRFLLIDKDGREKLLDGKAAGVTFGPDQRIAIETPGAGGYGLPAERVPEAVRRDVDSGKFSRAFVDREYGGTAELSKAGD
jgi:N-methylhydantoinase B